MGDAYNAEAGEISHILRTISGLDSFSNEAAAGGTDPEGGRRSVPADRPAAKGPGTSGNEAHYREWALECDGVGACKVTRLWAGPGTVRVLLVDYERQPVDEAVVERVAAHIEGKRPVGADVTVISAAGTAIDVAATVVLGGGRGAGGGGRRPLCPGWTPTSRSCPSWATPSTSAGSPPF